MQYTNAYALPRPMLNMLLSEEHEVDGDISVTQLLDPPRIHQLKKRHDDLYLDVMDSLMAMLGTAFHDKMQQHTERGKAELLLNAEYMGVTISGHIDWLHHTTITDYKVTSAWSFVYGKPEWEQQLNLYRWLAMENGYTVTELEIAAVFRDWQQNKASQSNYPSNRAMRLPQRLWLSDEREQFLEERVSAHIDAEFLSDDNLPYCTREERWVRGDGWAVYKDPDQERASKLFDADDELEAQSYADRFVGSEIKYRVGTSVRCERYCAASPVCNQWAKIQELELREEVETRPLEVG